MMLSNNCGIVLQVVTVFITTVVINKNTAASSAGDVSQTAESNKAITSRSSLWRRPALLDTATDTSLRTLLDTYQRAVETLRGKRRLSTLEFHKAQQGLKQRWHSLQQLEETGNGVVHDDDGDSSKGRQKDFSGTNESASGTMRRGRDLIGHPESLPIFNALGHSLHATHASKTSKNQSPRDKAPAAFGPQSSHLPTSTNFQRHQQQALLRPAGNKSPTTSSTSNLFAFQANPHSFHQQSQPAFLNTDSPHSNHIFGTSGGRIPAGFKPTAPAHQKSSPTRPVDSREDLDEEDSSAATGIQSILPLLSFLAPNAISSSASSSLAAGIAGSNQQLALPNLSASSSGSSSSKSAAAASPIQLFNIEETLANLTQGSQDLPGWSDLGVKPEPLMEPFPLQDLVCSKVFCCDTIFDRQATAGCCVIFALQMKVNVPCCSCMGFEVVNEGLFPGVPDILGLG